MPGSSDVLDLVLQDLLRSSPCRSMLDLGAGMGKYGRMMRTVRPEVKTTAIEVVADYITQFDLLNIYDDVRYMNMLDLMLDVDALYDLVIIGDAIEHLRKSNGVDLLQFLLIRSFEVLVVYPSPRLGFFQGTTSWGHHEEAHISLWDDTDFVMYSCVMHRDPDDSMRAVLIQGYREGRGLNQTM